MESHLLQMRGLKLAFCKENEYDEKVASFTDAWIETYIRVAANRTYCRIFYRCVD